ncbi:Hypothetical protein A7982_10965 [Minicystis rosea]|nr:Hypothetical protein A7982_10965 [Minicystis rosea]
MRLAAILGISTTLFGCGLPLADISFDGPVNTCTASTSCADGAACVDGICVATSYDLEGLLVEVRPRSDAIFGASTSHLFDPTAAQITLTAEDGAPFVAVMNPKLPETAAIRHGLVRLHKQTNCSVAEDQSIPARVTFYRAAPYAGFPFDPIAINSGANNEIDVDLVPGTYDVYIEPQVVVGCNDDKPFPPVYLPAQSIPMGGALIWDLPVVGTLTSTIKDFGDAIDGPWKIDLLEPTRGLPVSANAVLEKLAAPEDGYVVKAQIAWPDGPPPIVRLAPASTEIGANARPTAYWTIGEMKGTETNALVDFTVAELYKAPVQVNVNVLGSDSFTRIRATFTVQSSGLAGPNANNATFTIPSLETDAQGVLEAFLPPGNYDFRATPVDNGLAITDHAYTVNAQASCFCGQQFQLEPKPSLSAAVKTPSGERVRGTDVTIAPSLLTPRLFWKDAHQLAPMTARPVLSSTSDDGNFTVRIDPGLADLVIPTNPSSNYPWLVRPRLSTEADTEMGSLALTYPAVLRGTVRDANGAPVANAEVNAWFPVRDPAATSGLAGTVIKIATTQTDSSGNYRLLLPASL